MKQKKKNFKLIYLIIIIFIIICLINQSNVLISKFNGNKNNYKADTILSARDIETDINSLPLIDNTTDTSENATSARPFILYSLTGKNGGVSQKNYIHVFAFEGDTICLGTNIYNSGINMAGTAQTNTKHEDENSIDIVMHDLKGNLIGIDIKGEEGSPGYIADYKSELLARNMNSTLGARDNEGNAYVPFTYVVSETGVYTFEFRSYSGSGATNKSAAEDGNKTKGWDDPKNNTKQGAMIASWDITVFNENNEKEIGRTYTDYLAMQTTGTVKENYYLVTNDSYIYEMNLTGIQPYTFSFFANNRGITDSSNGNIVYKSVKDLKNTIEFTKFGVNYTNPTTDDTDLNKNFYIFFDKPNEDLKGHMYGNAILPDPATNVKFNQDGGIYEGAGGYFSFEVQEATTATLRIEFDIEGKDYTPVEISDVVKPYSTSYFYWDGKDGDGNVIEAGEYTSDQIKYSVTTKAGEIHFPLIDVENVTDGITFTRINDIYEKNGNKVTNEIYEKTKNVVYYDETAIYYGEKITNTGATEKDITYEVKKTGTNGNSISIDMPVPFGADKNGLNDAENRPIYAFRNILSKDNSEYKLYTTYGQQHNLKVGDHSYLNNKIDFQQTYSSQSGVIDYLDSKKHPVGLSKTSNYLKSSVSNILTTNNSSPGNYNSTTDYGIANYWTFITAKTTESDDKNGIKIIDSSKKDLFNLQARVFYDEGGDKANGVFDEQVDGDHLLSDVTLNLYKKTSDQIVNEGKTYVKLSGTDKEMTIEKVTSLDSENNIYELVKSGVTPLKGEYTFSGIEYDKNSGTEFLYEVVKPNSSLEITSKEQKGKAKSVSTTMYPELNNSGTAATKETEKFDFGIYSLYKYNSDSFGTEIQTFTVGGTGINLEAQDNKTVTTIDVGYKYNRTTYELDVKKIWENEGKEKPESVLFEISYTTEDGKTTVYEERALSEITSWNNSFKYLETEINGNKIKDWYVSAEYYIYKDKVFKHTYKYDLKKSIYESFVGQDYYFSLKEYNEKHNIVKETDENYTKDDIPDLNKDGVSDWDDLKEIKDGTEGEICWKKALSAGSVSSTDSDIIAPFNSVIDRNVGTAVTEISITNSSKPGTVEILKYKGELKDGNYLGGATFRIYDGTVENVKSAINEYNTTQSSLNNNPSDEQLQKKFKDASNKVDEMQVGSATTRVNGRVAFSGLDPEKTYTVRERFAPSGYRIVEEYYQINPKGTESGNKFNEENYCLLNIRNVEARGELEIRKTINGRAWVDSDNFTFDIKFDSDPIITTEEKALFNNNQNIDEKIKEFTNSFSSTDDIIIDGKKEFLKLKNNKLSTDTKVYTSLLKSGITSDDSNEKASLKDIEFPAAGDYTFTISENEVEHGQITIDQKKYKVTINVERYLNSEEVEGTDVTLENSHLEANVSKIEVQEAEGKQAEVYSEDAILFTNEYVVEDVHQDTKYIVKKELTGRDWVNDEFTFIVEGKDETTKQALKDGKIILKGTSEKDELDDGNIDGTKKIVITKNNKDDGYLFSEIDFDDNEFKVEKNEDGTPITKMIEYYLDIKEKLPEDATEANGYISDGIRYSKDVYTLKATLKNSDDEHIGDSQEETDGIIDEIVFELYKNYELNSNSEPLSTCIINRTKNSDGTITEKAKHDTKKDGHLMLFTNKYEMKTINVSKIWEDNNDETGARPEKIKLTVVDDKENKYETELKEDITERNSNTGDSEENSDNNYGEDDIWIGSVLVPEFDASGNTIKYTIKEETVPTGYTASVNENDFIVKNTINKYKYKIKYHYNNGTTEEIKEEEEELPYKTEINRDDLESRINEKKTKGYRLAKQEEIESLESSKTFNNGVVGLPLTVLDNEENNVIDVYYIKDENEKKTISYKIKIFKDGELNEEKEITKDIQWLEEDTTFDTTIIDQIISQYEKQGYKLNKESTKEFPDKVKNGDEILLYFDSVESHIKVRYIYNITEQPIENEEEVDIQGILYHECDLSTYKKEIPGYKLIKEPDSLNVIFQEDIQTFDFIYGKETSVEVQHIDINNSETPLQVETIDGIVGQEYTTNSIKIDEYVLVDEEGYKPEKTEGKMEDTKIIVKYYYRHISKGIIERHIDVKSEKILDSTTHEGNEGEKITINSKSFEGYDLYEKENLNPEGTTFIFTKDLIEINYYYIRKASVKVEYIDRKTGKELPGVTDDNREIIEGHEGDSYETTEKQFEGYNLLKEPYPKNAKGIMEITIDEESNEITTQTIVKYYYATISEGVIEKHIDVKSGKVIEENRYSGSVGDAFFTSSKKIEGYDLVTDKEHTPKIQKGIMEEKEIEVLYYYIKKVKIRVEYLEEETEQLLRLETIDGHEDDKYNTEKKNIDGYIYTNVLGEIKGIMKEDLTVKYYYKIKEQNEPVSEIAESGSIDSGSSSTASEVIDANIKNVIEQNDITTNNNFKSNIKNTPNTGDTTVQNYVSLILIIILFNIIEMKVHKSINEKYKNTNLKNKRHKGKHTY